VVKVEARADGGRGRLVAVRELIEYARVREGKAAVQPTLLQHANLAGVEAIEAAYGVDAGSKGGLGQGRSPPKMVKVNARVTQILDLVK